MQDWASETRDMGHGHWASWPMLIATLRHDTDSNKMFGELKKISSEFSKIWDHFLSIDTKSKVENSLVKKSIKKNIPDYECQYNCFYFIISANSRLDIILIYNLCKFLKNLETLTISEWMRMDALGGFVLSPVFILSSIMPCHQSPHSSTLIRKINTKKL